MTHNELDTADATECESPALQPEAGTRDEGVPTESFPDGEIETDTATSLDPASATERFVKHRSGSVREAVLSTVAFSKGVSAFSKNQGEFQQFFDGMVKAKAVTKTEAAARLAGTKTGPTISKLNKIAEYEHILSDPKIASLIPPGYTTMYECVQLYEVLNENSPATALDELHKLLVEHDGPVTRDWLKKQRDGQLRPAKPAKETEPAPSPDERPAEEHYDEYVDEGGTDERTQAEVIVQGDPGDQVKEEDNTTVDEAERGTAFSEAISAVLMTLNEQDVSRFIDKMVEVARIADDIGDDAVLLVHAPLGLLLSMRGVLEPFGMDRCERIYLLTQPSVPNVTDRVALAVYARGDVDVTGSIAEWDTETDPTSLAELILDGIDGRKVHLFGQTKAAGWESITGTANPTA